MCFAQKATNTQVPCIQYLAGREMAAPASGVEWFSKIDLSGERGKVIEVLKVLEPRVKDLSVVVIGGVSGIYADIGLPRRLSINVLGDGVNKLILIALYMLANPGAILLIDEIENGFHYSLFPKLWETIAKLAAETRCQVFATTHSYECISGAIGPVTDEKNGNLFRFVRLDRQDGTIVSHIFENDSLKYAIRNDWEVR
jgi:hypothetical protein